MELSTNSLMFLLTELSGLFLLIVMGLRGGLAGCAHAVRLWVCAAFEAPTQRGLVLGLEAADVTKEFLMSV